MRGGIYGGLGLVPGAVSGQGKMAVWRETSRSLCGRAIPRAGTDADKPGRRTEWLPFFITAKGHGPMVGWFSGHGSAWRQPCPRHVTQARTRGGDSATPRRPTRTTTGGAGPCLTWMGFGSGTLEFPSTQE